MRSTIVESVKGLNLNGLSIAQELPYDESGTPLYIKNPKRIYIGRESTEIVPLVTILNGNQISLSTTRVSVFFTTDAKNPPLNYETNLNNIKGIQISAVFDGSNNRSAAVSQTYEGDLLITEVEFTFIRLT